MFFVLKLIFIWFCLYLYFKYSRRLYLGLKIPGPWFIPFLGNVQFIKFTPENLFMRVSEYGKQYKDCFRIWLGAKLWVFIHNPKDIETVLNNRELFRVEEFYQLHPLIGDGLLLIDGTPWSLHRRALSPAFSSNILNEFLPVISRHADVLVAKLQTQENTDVTDSLLLFVLDTICDTSMGAHMNAQMDKKCAYAEAFHNASDILFKRMSNFLVQFDFIFRLTPDYKKLREAIKVLHSLTDGVIKRKRRQYAGVSEDIKKHKTLALLDNLLQCEINGKRLTDREIRDHVTTFLFAGIDTTKAAMSFLLYNIAKYKNVQNRLYQEIISLIGSDPGQDINPSYFQDLPYLDQVMKESLRVHTTVPVSARRTIKEVTIGNYTYPKETSIWINIFGVSHDPRIFRNPDEFNPDRFERQDWLEEHGEYAFIPYSAGPRYCIGKKYSIYIMKTVVIKMLLNYEINLINPSEELQLLAEMVLKSKTGINLRFQNRSNTTCVH